MSNRDTSEPRFISRSELSQHNRPDDCWIALHGRVYDVTAFLKEHPGGVEVITCLAGEDASNEFEDIGHSLDSRKQAIKYEIGIMEGLHETIALGAMFGKQSFKPVLHLVNSNRDIDQLVHTAEHKSLLKF